MSLYRNSFKLSKSIPVDKNKDIWVLEWKSLLMPHYSAQIGFVFNINLILSFFFSLLLGCASTLSPYLLCLYSQLKEFMGGGGTLVMQILPREKALLWIYIRRLHNNQFSHDTGYTFETQYLRNALHIIMATLFIYMAFHRL